MKTKLILISLLLGAPLLLAAAEADMVAGVDLSAKTTITGSLLNQLVDNATTAAKKGMVIRQSTTPDTVTYPRYTNFVWLDTSTTTPILKCWNGSAWVATTVAAGSVDNTSLAGSAVDQNKIAGSGVVRTNIAALAIDNTRIDFNTINLGNMGPASVGRGQLITGSVGSTQLTNSAVVTTTINDSAVITDKLTNGAVTTAKLAANAVSYTAINTNSLMYAQVAADGTILASKGISGITKTSTGNYILNFATARAGTNYIVSSMAGPASPWYVTAFTSNFVGSVTIQMYSVAGAALANNAFNVLILDPQVP